MSLRLHACTISLLLALSSGLFARLPQAPLEERLQAPLAEALRVAATGGAEVERLYQECMRVHGDATPLLEHLETTYLDESESAEVDADARQSARWLMTRLLHRHGDLPKARKLAERLVEDSPTLEAWLHRADLLDTDAQTEDAEQAYREALQLCEDPAVRHYIRLRLALLRASHSDAKSGSTASTTQARAISAATISTIRSASGAVSISGLDNGKTKAEKEEKDSDAVEELVSLALEEDQARSFRNRSAIVLAMLDEATEAIDLFEVHGQSTARFRQEIRLAGWALAGNRLDDAQTFAWAAWESAKLRRDRRYALTLLVEAYREHGALPELIDIFANTADLDEDTRNVWIDLLRETGQIEEALRLFREANEADFTVEMRRELLEMCRESGQEDVLVAAYRELIAAEPQILEWREGLSRYQIERGHRERAIEEWREFIATQGDQDVLLGTAEIMMGLSLDELAMDCAERCLEHQSDSARAMLFLYGLHLDRGRMEDAEAALERMDANAAPDSKARMELSEAFERLGNQARAVEVLEGLKHELGAEQLGEDLEMRLAWLYSEIGEEEKALEAWHALWLQIQSIPRRRYVEDRLMTVASRLGRLADVAVDLEQKLIAGEADARDSGLLVRLYTKVGDAVSAAEIIDEFMKQTGGNPVETLKEKSRVYLACTDFYNYEKTIRKLIEIDPEEEADYLRQLAMSNLERARPDEARRALARLRDLDDGSDGAEFEAGVLALAGMRAEAIETYRRGLAIHPERIDVNLLLANVMKELGQTELAVGMFQYLAQTAEKDDLFTIAIDGLLNMEAPQPILRWARRITLERLAGRHDKMYLYQLISDVSEELQDWDMMFRALESSLAISGERRASILRELMDLAVAHNRPEQRLKYGRRLIGLGELVPPQVYLDLGDAFLAADDVLNAAKTFNLASDVPDQDSFQQKVAESFENAGFLHDALRVYERILIGKASNIGLLVKTAELHEQIGRDDLAIDLYRRGLDLLLSRRNFSDKKAEEDEDAPFAWWAARNVDDFDQHYDRILKGYLVTSNDEAAIEGHLTQQQAQLEEDLRRLADEQAAARETEEETSLVLASHPRLRDRASFLRRSCLAFGRIGQADRIDLQLLAAFPDDSQLLPRLCRTRLSYGQLASARDLIEKAPRSEEAKREVRYLVGRGSAAETSGLVPVSEAARLFLPLIVAGKDREVRELLQRLDLSSGEKDDIEALPMLQSAAVYLEDSELVLNLSRHWIAMAIRHQENYEQANTIMLVLNRGQALLDLEQQQSLLQYVVSLMLENPERTISLTQQLTEWQARVDEPLLTGEQAQELIETKASSQFYGTAPLFNLVAPDEMTSILRAIWPKVAKSRRCQFLLELLEQLRSEAGEGMEDFIVGAFKESLVDLKDERFLRYYVEQGLGSDDSNLAIEVRVAKILVDHNPEQPNYNLAYATCLKKLGRNDEALAEATGAFRRLLTQKGDWSVDRVLREIPQLFPDDEVDHFLSVIDDVIEEGGDRVEITKKRLNLVRSLGDRDRILEENRAAVAANPEEVFFLNRLINTLRNYGYLREAQDQLARLVELEPDNESHRHRLVSGWKSLRHPTAALDAMEEMLARRAENEDEEPEEVEEEEVKIVKFEDPTTMQIKNALEEGDLAQARTTFRRLWRNFQRASDRSRGTVYIIVNGQVIPYGRQGDMTWPADEEESDEPREIVWSRGGLETLLPKEDEQDEDAESEDESENESEPERRTAYQALASEAFGEAEMRSQLRSLDASGLDRAKDVFKGLVEAVVGRLGVEGAIEELMQRVLAGKAGKPDYFVLLTLLEQHPEQIDERARTVLDELRNSLHPQDGQPLLRLARIHVALGEVEEALRIYRWCATLSTASRWGDDLYSQVSAHELLREVKDGLEGEAQVEAIDAILRNSDPGDDAWERDWYERMVLDTWKDVLGPEKALEKARAVCESATDTGKGVKRSTSQAAAVLFANNQEWEAAIRALEYGVCEFELSEVSFEGSQSYWLEWSLRHHFLNHDLMHELFPADTEGWEDAGSWFELAAENYRRWLADDRVPEHNAWTILAILALRLHEHDRSEAAGELVEFLAEETHTNAYHQLIVADVALELGQEALAGKLQRRLFDEQRLNIERVPEVVAAIQSADGARAAFEQGLVAAEYCHHPALLDRMAQLAEEVETEQDAGQWRQRQHAAAAAEDRLRAIAEAEREANESE